LSDDYRFLRERMVQLIESRGVQDRAVLQAMRELPRHLFVSEPMQTQAYGDHALPIGSSQTISQPWVVARMTELLRVESTHTVLEVGTGSGYQTAVLAKLARWVYSLERISDLARRAIRRIQQLGLENVKIQTFDGTVGWSDAAPFDRILVTAAAPAPPPPLLRQLRIGGRMLIPEGEREEQRLVVYDKLADGVSRREGEGVVFVPLIGRHAWEND
jgi:protein-L-isoaspartate(D-aspartate) O-methyltransferase